MSEEEFTALCEANSFGSVARGEFALIPRAMLKSLVDAAVAAGQDAAEDLYGRLETMSKALESSGRIDEHDQPDAYATVLDAMKFVRASGEA